MPTVAVKDVLELSDRRRDLEAEVEDLLLALKTDVLRPSDHAAKVAGGLDILTDTEVSRPLLDERVLFGKLENIQRANRRSWNFDTCLRFLRRA